MTKKERKRKKKLQMQNKRLIKKYYWLMPRNVWTDKIDKNYDYTYINWGWCYGWDKAFGMMYLEELGAAIKKAGQKNFRILELKEKYGQCRNYTSGTTAEVHAIIDKYEKISENICCGCGNEAPMIDDGWMSPYCFECWCKIQKSREKYYKKLHPENELSTDDELFEQYKNYIVDKPDENGEYHIRDTYHVRRFYPGGNEDFDIDISETANKIRDRQHKWMTYHKYDER